MEIDPPVTIGLDAYQLATSAVLKLDPKTMTERLSGRGPGHDCAIEHGDNLEPIITKYDGHRRFLAAPFASAFDLRNRRDHLVFHR